MKTTQTQIKDNKTPESDNQRNETRAANVMRAEALGYADASEQFKTQGCFSSGRTWDHDPEMSNAYDQGVNRAEAEELRKILVDRSEFKLADNVVSARVVIKMLEKKRCEAEAHAQRLADALQAVMKSRHLLGLGRCPDLQPMIREALAEWSKQK